MIGNALSIGENEKPRDLILEARLMKHVIMKHVLGRPDMTYDEVTLRHWCYSYESMVLFYL